MYGNMRLFKCLVPVLVLLLVESSSAKPFDEMYQFYGGATQINGNGNATSTGVTNAGSPDLWQFLTNYTLSVIAAIHSKANPFPSQTTVPEQSGQPGQWVLVPFAATNAGRGAGPSTFRSSGSANNSRVPGENSKTIADVNAGSSRVGGFGGIASNTGINFGGSGSSGSGQEGHDGSNGDFSSNVKADAVPTAGASSGSLTDGSDGSSAYRQDNVSAETSDSSIVGAIKSGTGGLSSAIFNANSNTSGGLASSSSKSTASSSSKSMASSSGNAMAQSTSSAISTDDENSASSYASASADTND